MVSTPNIDDSSDLLKIVVIGFLLGFGGGRLGYEPTRWVSHVMSILWAIMELILG
jgi:hypothetical protein